MPPAWQKAWLGKEYGKSASQFARRLFWNEPCLTLLTKPIAKRTERCHPDETRPLTVREYARIQTFPDDRRFQGPLCEQYRQIGSDNADHVQLKIKDRLKNNIHPSCLGLFDVIHKMPDNKSIIKIIIASGTEKPYYIKKYGMSEKGCFIRLGSASEPMSTKMIEALFSRRTRNSISRIRSPRQNLTFEQLKIYYNEADLTPGKKFAANLELLTEEGDYNYAAYLLADEDNNSVQLAKYGGIEYPLEKPHLVMKINSDRVSSKIKTEESEDDRDKGIRG